MIIPNKYIDKILSIEPEGGLWDDCKYMVYFKEEHSIYGDSVPCAGRKDLDEIMEDYWNE